jgi:hypothetical protein
MEFTTTTTSVYLYAWPYMVSNVAKMVFKEIAIHCTFVIIRRTPGQFGMNIAHFVFFELIHEHIYCVQCFDVLYIFNCHSFKFIWRLPCMLCPDTKWVVHLLSNVTFYVNKINEYPIGVNVLLPDYVLRNPGVVALITGSNGYILACREGSIRPEICLNLLRS